MMRGPQRRHQLFPELERTPDISRGEMRLAAEAMLSSNVPADIAERATRILTVMARN